MTEGPRRYYSSKLWNHYGSVDLVIEEGQPPRLALNDWNTTQYVIVTPEFAEAWRTQFPEFHDTNPEDYL